jgi:hypothetical protein
MMAANRSSWLTSLENVLHQEHRFLGQADVDLVDVAAKDGLAKAVHEIGDAQGGHQQGDAFLVDQFAQHQALDQPSHRHHHQHRRNKGQQIGQQLVVKAAEAGNPLGKARHGQRGEQHHGALCKVEDPRSLEDEHEAQGHQRIQHACHQAADQGFDKRSHGLPQWLVPRYALMTSSLLRTSSGVPSPIFLP